MVGLVQRGWDLRQARADRTIPEQASADAAW